MANKVNIGKTDDNGVRYFDLGTQNNYMDGTYGSAAKRKGSAWKGFAIFLAIMLVIMTLGVFFGNFAAPEPVVEDVSYEYIALINISGQISDTSNNYAAYANGYNHKMTLQIIDRLINDDDNRGLIICCTTPGGSVYASDELCVKLKEYQEETGNPYYMVMGSQCTSGGYYISAPADKIYANINTWTGSIGVTLGDMFDFSGLLEKYGVKVNTITSGENKAMGDYFKEMSDEEREIWQALIDESYERFVGEVAEGRDMEVEEVKKWADGRILSATQALEIGFVDEIGDRDTAYKAMLKEIKEEEEDVALRNVTYVPKNSGLYDILYGVTSTISPKSDAGSIIDLAESMSGEPVSYLCVYKM